MMAPPRYALYFMPAVASPLWRFGCRVIGYDAADATPPEPFGPLGGAAEAGAFAEPARYGFHATLKAPFELAPGRSEAELAAAATRFAARRSTLPIGTLKVARLERFIALVPVAAPPALEDLAGAVVRDFDSFRAPLSAADRERRLQAPLSPAEIAHLDRWGYPYVFEDFRFHMTLSGPLRPNRIEALCEMLAGLYAPIDTPVAVDGFAIFKQAGRQQPFKVLQRFAFG